MQERIITIAVKIKDAKEAEIFWDAHAKNELFHGSKIIAIAEGNAIDELEDLHYDMSENDE